MRSMWSSIYARLFGLKLAFLQTNSRRIVLTVSARKMSYSTVERGSPFSLDYRVYLSKKNSTSGSGYGGCVFLATELKFWLKLLSASIGCCVSAAFDCILGITLHIACY